MVNENEDRYDAQDEGEYHFSEDQINYDVEGETPKPTTRLLSQPSILSKISPRTRAIIAGVVFIILMSVVLKMLVPTQGPSTEFSPATATPPPVAVAEKPKAPAPPPITAVQLQPTQTVIATERPKPPPVEPTAPVVVATQPSQPQSMPQTATTVATPSGAVPSTISPPVIISNEETPPTSTTTISTPVQQTVVSAPPVSQALPSQDINQRLAALEKQNSVMMNLLQTEYAQKLADYEAQESAFRGKMDELNKRVNRIEEGINQMTLLLKNADKPSSPPPSPLASQPPVRAHVPRITYTVQAIIPGRAWLKSESGDTVTVAEGDMLRDYGRIAKIDPYDGIVNIDVGNKIITLSYGNMD